jgi:hypothetical protein
VQEEITIREHSPVSENVEEPTEEVPFSEEPYDQDEFSQEDPTILEEIAKKPDFKLESDEDANENDYE